jgi:hypothetical protein
MTAGRESVAVFVFSAVLLGVHCAPRPAEGPNQARRSDSYQDLLRLFEEWREFQKPPVVEGVPDYTRTAMEQQRRGLTEFQRRLAAIDSSKWPIAQRVDYHLVRAEMNGLEFDHRVARPWSRNPAFYRALHPSGTDVPAREGSETHGVLEVFRYKFPLAGEELADFRIKLRAIPRLLEQAKGNLTEEAGDLWFAGIWVKQREAASLSELAKRLAEHNPDLVPLAEEAKRAVDDFRAWLETKQRDMKAPSGIGAENYTWYMKNVLLSPYSWEEQVTIIQRELDRSWATLKLEENRNRGRPPLTPAASEAEYQRRFHAAVTEFMDFLRQQEVCTVADYMDGALRARLGRFIPPAERRDFFTQIDYRDSLPMRCHGSHWFDLARMEAEPHASPIRRVPLLYNLWDARAEGLATGMEEMMMHAGLFDNKPRARELIHILLANRAARAMGDLRMHSNEMTLEEAVEFAVDWTPYGWLPKEGNTVWVDELLYLQKPGYGTSYVIGKTHIERLLADRAQQLGERFSLKEFMDGFHASGMIPLSLIRWEMTGREDEIKELGL